MRWFMSLLIGLALMVNGAVAQKPNNPVPTSGATMLPTLQTFLRSEDANRYRDLFGRAAVVSGCSHATVASTTSPTFACVAYVPTGYRIEQVAAAITYANGNGLYWVAVDEDATTVRSGWTRTSGTHYLRQLSATYPTDIPSTAMIVMAVTVSSSAITAVNFLGPRLPEEGAAAVYIRDVGAVCDGTTDDAKAFQTAHDKLPASGGTIYVTRGTGACVITTNVQITKPNVILRGVGVPTIHGVDLDLDGDGKASINLFELATTADGFEAHNIVWTQAWTDELCAGGICQGKAINCVVGCDNITVTGNRFEGLGIAIEDSNHFKASGNTFDGSSPSTGDYGIYIRAGSYGIIDGNTFARWSSDGVKFAGDRDGVTTTPAQGHVISNNVFFDITTGGEAIDMFNAGEDLVITGNVAYNTGKMMNIKLGGNDAIVGLIPARVIVTNNFASGMLEHCIALGVSHITFANNICLDTDVTSGQGAILVGSNTGLTNPNGPLFIEDVIIVGNHILNTTDNGGTVDGTGIHLNQQVRNVIASHNTIMNAETYGFLVESCDVLIDGNFILDTTRGINVNQNTVDCGTTVQNITITNNRIVDGPLYVLDRGISLSANTDFAMLSGNDVQGAVTPLSDSSVLTYKGMNSFSPLGEVGTFTLTGTGFGTPPTATARYTRNGDDVVLQISTLSGTSNATTFTMTGMPAGLFPARAQNWLVRAQNNSVTEHACMALDTAGVFTMGEGADCDTSGGAAWTNSGTKAISSTTIVYTLK